MNARAFSARVVVVAVAFEGASPLLSGLVLRAGFLGGEVENLSEVGFG